MTPETPPPQTPDEDDPRLAAAVREFIDAREQGRRLTRQELLARHPDLADLSACLQGLSFLDSAAAQLGRDASLGSGSAGATVDHALEHAEPLGDFRLVREIGRGGMGVVYEAWQISLGRRVALKVLPMASSLDPRHLQRFRNEAHAAAQLHHANIVPVYAVGSERAVHFYAMQLIEGRSLSQVIRALRAERGSEGTAHAPSSPTDPVSLRTSGRPGEFHRFVARIGAQAARALQYAHELGIVHRDIKPGNLLLDAPGNVWVTDFGLAQMYAEAGEAGGAETREGDAPGTFRYMSPEQASGQVRILDARTDVYSLGVTLYELLTLRAAVPEGTREEMLEVILNRDPPPPRAIDPAIPRELETILAKAAAKEADERYFTAGAMADDFERFLRDEPILARPPTIWDRGVRLVRRHRRVALASAAALMVATVGLTAATALLAAERAQTVAASQAERIERQRASRSFGDARAAVDFMTRIAAEEMPADPALIGVRRRLLQGSLDYYQKFIEAGQPGEDLSAARGRVASLLAQLEAADEQARMNVRFRLASSWDVQRQLGVSTAQRQKITALAAAGPDGFPPDGGGPGPRGWDGGGGGGGGPMGGDFDLDTASRADVTQRDLALRSILTVAQHGRLVQIFRQWQGPLAFRDPDVERALELTPEQKAVIATACAEVARPGPGPGGDGGGGGRGHDHGRPGDHDPDHQGPGGPGGDGPPGPARNVARRREALATILGILRPHQQSAWAAITGAPFTFAPFRNFDPDDRPH